MRSWLAVLAGTVVVLAGTAVGEPPAGDAFDKLGVDLLTIPATNAVERKALSVAEKLVGKPSGSLKIDVAKAKQLAKILGRNYGDNVLLDNDLDAVLNQMESSVSAEKSALEQRTASQPDGKPKTAAQAQIDAANAKLISAHAAAVREEKANDLGMALQNILKGEADLKDDIYFYVVVNGEAFFTTQPFDSSYISGAYIAANGQGEFFTMTYVSARDAGSGLTDVVSMAVTGIPKAREYELQDYMATHSRQDNRANAPDGFREIIVKGSDSFVKFLRVDKRKQIVAGIFQFTVHEDTDVTKVDRVRYGSFRVHYK